MKTIILCGGTGTRMKEETEFRPKPLVEIGGKPILWHIMKIYAYFGFNEFILALGYKGNMIKEYFLNWRTMLSNFSLNTQSGELTFGSNDCDNFKITFVETGLDSLTGERVRRLKNYIGADEHFMVTYGDGVADIDISALVEFHKNNKTLGTITGVKPISRLGLLDIDLTTNKLLDFTQHKVTSEHEIDSRKDIINGGFMVFNREIMDMIEPNSMIESIFPVLAKTRQLSVYIHKGKWKCMDTHKEMEELNELWQKEPFWKIWEKNALIPENTNLVAQSAGEQSLQNFYRNKKVLITGHSGFKGSWLVKILSNWGAEIVGISLPPDSAPNLFETLDLNKKLKVNYFVDIRDFNKIKEIIANEKPEIIFHLAAQPLVRDSYNDPITTYSTNAIGTANVLQAIKEAGSVKSVVIITTDKVYENKEWLYPYREIEALGGYDPYSASKAAADIIANSYIQSFFNPSDFGLKHHTLVAIARAGNVIGGGDWAKDRLVPDMIRAIFERKEAVIIRNPNAVRPWQHVLEPLKGYLMLGQQLYNGEKKISGAWNFGPNEDDFACVEELVKKGLLILSAGSYQIVEDQTKHEANLLKLDINKAKNILNWQPKWQFADSLKATFEWYGQFYRDARNIDEFTNKQINLYFDD